MHCKCDVKCMRWTHTVLHPLRVLPTFLLSISLSLRWDQSNPIHWGHSFPLLFSLSSFLLNIPLFLSESISPILHFPNGHLQTLGSHPHHSSLLFILYPLLSLPLSLSLFPTGLCYLIFLKRSRCHLPLKPEGQRPKSSPLSMGHAPQLPVCTLKKNGVGWGDFESPTKTPMVPNSCIGGPFLLLDVLRALWISCAPQPK